MATNRHDAYLQDLPLDWAKVPIEEIGDIFAGGTPSRANTHYWNGSIAIAGIEICTNQGFKNIVPNSFSDSLFYYYLLYYIAAEMQRLASGSTFDEISRRDLVQIIVPHPNPLEQYHRA